MRDWVIGRQPSLRQARLWLTALAVLAALPLAGIAVERAYRDVARAVERAQSEAFRLASLLAAQKGELLGGADEILGILATLPEVRNAAREPQSCMTALDRARQAVDRYAHIGVVDAAGVIVCGSPTSALGRHVRDRPWFQRVTATQAFSVGDYAVGMASGKRSVHFAAPVRGDDGAVGAVNLALDLAWVADRLSRLPIDSGAVITLVDAAGTIVARHPGGADLVGKPLGLALPGGLGTLDAVDVDGVRRIHGVAPLGRPGESGLRLLVGLDRASIADAARARSLAGLAIVAALLAAGIAAAWAGGGHLAARRAARERRLREGEDHARIAAELEATYATAPVGMCVLDTDLRFVRINERLAEINGHPAAAHRGRHVREMVPDLTQQAEALLRRILDTGEPVRDVEIVGETAARPGVKRTWRESWHPLRDDGGRVIGINIVAEETTERKQAEERRQLLANEVEHRAKNALTLVLSILRVTRARDVPSFVRAVERRIAALARVHTLLAERSWSGVDLGEIVRRELTPYDTARVVIDGPPTTLAPPAAQPMAMALHELATNAVKYGALSAPGGHVDIRWTRGADRLRLRWTERGGPPAAPPSRRGFGSRVIEQIVAHQLDGAVRFEWPESGLVCTVDLPNKCLADGLTTPARPHARESAGARA